MRKLVMPLIVTALFVAAMAYQAKTVDPVLCEAPEVELPELAGYASSEFPVSEAELTTLPSDTQFRKRLYVDAEVRNFSVSAVIGGRSKSSVHRPELCLPSQGFQMMSPRVETIGGVEWHFVTLARRDAPPMQFAYTFFNQAGFRTSSHMKRIFRDVWDRSILCRIDRWVMVTVHSSSSREEDLKTFLDRLKGVVKLQ